MFWYPSCLCLSIIIKKKNYQKINLLKLNKVYFSEQDKIKRKIRSIFPPDSWQESKSSELIILQACWQTMRLQEMSQCRCVMVSLQNRNECIFYFPPAGTGVMWYWPLLFLVRKEEKKELSVVINLYSRSFANMWIIDRKN